MGYSEDTASEFLRLLSATNGDVLNSIPISVGRFYNDAVWFKTSVYATGWYYDSATGQYPVTLDVWQPSTGDYQSLLSSNSSYFQAVALAPDGQTFALGGGYRGEEWRQGPGLFELHNGTDGSVLDAFAPHKAAVKNALFTHDEKTIVSASSDGVIKIWNLSGDLLRTLPLSGHLASLALSPNGRQAAAAVDGKILLFSLSDGSIQHLIPAIQNTNGLIIAVNALVFSPDGRYLAGCYDQPDNRVLLWRASDLAVQGIFQSQQRPHAMAFTPDGASLAVSTLDNPEYYDGSDSYLYLLHSPDLTLSRTLFFGFGFPAGRVQAFAFSPEGTHLAINTGWYVSLYTFPDMLHIWTKLPPLDPGEFINFGETFHSQLAFDPAGGHVVATNNPHGKLQFWRTTDGTLDQLYDEETEEPVGELSQPAFSLHSHYFVYGRPDATVVMARNPNYGTATGIDFPKASGRPDQRVQLQAFLYRRADIHPLAGKALTFRVNGVLVGTSITDRNGNATVTYNVLHNTVEAAYPMSVTFEGDATDARSSVSSTFFVPYRTLLTASSIKGFIGTHIALRALLRTTPAGDRLSGKEVEFSLKGSHINLGATTYTGSDGVGSTSVLLDSRYFTPETVPIKVTFPGDDMHLTSHASASLVILYAPKVTVANVSGKAGQTILLRALLRRKPDAQPVAGATLTFKVEGQTVGTAVTDAKGNAALPWTIPADSASGSKAIRVEFAGDSVVGAGYGTATLTVP